MFNNVINNWFYDESVQPADMKLMTQTFLQLCFAANGGEPQAMGITPTVNGNQINTTRGFVYFGETSDQTFIDNTGTNQLMAFVAPAATNIVNADCYLYIKPNIATDVNNRTSIVTGILYTSINPDDEGIQLATIANNIITIINSINPNGATGIQRGVISFTMLNDLFARLAANNTFTGDNLFEGVTNVYDPTTLVPLGNTQAINVKVLFDILKDYATNDQVDADLSLYAKLLSPLFQGNPRAPIPPVQDNGNTIPTTSWVNGLFDIDLGVMVFQNKLCLQFGFGTANYTGFSQLLPLKFTKSFGAVCNANGAGFGSGAKIGTDNQTLTMYTYDATAGNIGYFYIAIGTLDLNKPVGVDWKPITLPTDSFWNFLAGQYNNDVYGYYNKPSNPSANYLVKISMLNGEATNVRTLTGPASGGSLVELSNGIIFIAAANGIFSTDNGATWSASAGISVPLNNYYLTSVAVPNTTNILVVTTYSTLTGVYLFQSKNSGVSFTNISSKIPNAAQSNGFIQVENGILLAIRDTSNNLKYYLTEDSGDNFTLIGTIPATSNPYNDGGLYRIGNRIYNCLPVNLFEAQRAGNGGTVYYTDDEGYTWQPITGIPTNAAYQEIRLGLDENGQQLWLHGSTLGIYKSSDGINFTLLNGSLPCRGICFIENKWIITGAAQAPYYFYSLDGAQTFTPANTGGATGSASPYINETTKSIVAYSSGFSGGVI